MQRVLGGLLLGAAMLVGGCTAPPTETDADQGIQCAADRDCSDGQFCNGIELCLPRSTNADERGCVAPNASPCQDSQTCDATNGTCVTRCELAPDADADGHLAVACGGDDCDDSDPDRFPGNLEVCDDLMHDEDCSPTTFGDLDADSDGWYSAACCNVDGAGTLFCGDDCNDSESTAHPSEAEACDGIDNDCDDAVDEGGRVFYEDRDGDGFGSTAGVSVEA